MKRCVESAPVTPMQQEWFEHILTMIPEQLKQGHMREVIQELFQEVLEGFDKSMKKSMGEFISWKLRLQSKSEISPSASAHTDLLRITTELLEIPFSLPCSKCCNLIGC